MSGRDQAPRGITSAPAEEPHLHTWHENRRYCTPPTVHHEYCPCGAQRTRHDTPDNTEQLAQM